MRLPLLFSFLSLSLFLFSNELNLEEVFLRRINAHLLLEDPLSALSETETALRLYPNSLPLSEAFIRTLACLGNEKEMLLAWNKHQERFAVGVENKELIEEMAWGVLNKASRSPSLPVRQMSLLAAFFSQDRRAIPLLQQAMRDSNYAVRAFAVKFAGHMRDQKLIDEIKRLFLEEKNFTVRLEVIKAIGSMKIRTLEGKLKELVASNILGATEKAAAIASLIQLWQGINRPEIESLAKSDRAGLRLLAAKSIAYFQSKRDIDLLIDLTKDSHSDVRVAAFYSIGQINPEEQKEKIIEITRESIQNFSGDSSLAAAWLLTFYQKEEGLAALGSFIKKREVEALAIAALNHTGKRGIPLMIEVFEGSSDPFTKLNLAVGLIRQQTCLNIALPSIREFLLTYKGKLSKKDDDFFDGFSPFSESNSSDLLMTPELENQLLRLELLEILAAYDDPYAQEAAKLYLQERSWGITATASALLLTEGDSECVPLVESLLEDPNPTVRFQAALVLSLFTREDSIIKILEEEYEKGDWDMRLRILESFGRIGSMRSLPFLVNKLGEEAQSLRLITAVAIIQTLNH